MKCLSGRQPWWWAILHAGKRIENRRWNTKYRGPILLHAAKGCGAREFLDAGDWMLAAGVIEDVVFDIPALDELPRGGIVGRARIVDVYRPLLSGGVDPGDTLCRAFSERYGIDHRWRMPEQFGFVLADVEPLPFRPYKGALGLFDVPDELAR